MTETPTILALCLHRFARGRAPKLAMIGVLGSISISLASALAIELTEPIGAAHAYPALYDKSGKKLADGEFRQWIQDDLVNVAITYKFSDGRHFEERALFRQHAEVIEERWSWKESREGKSEREFTVDFVAGMASANIPKENKYFSEKIDIESGRTFAGFGFTIALSNLRKRLINGEQIELKAVGFTPKPRVVTVKISHVGLERVNMSGRFVQGDNFVIRPEVPAIARLLMHVPDTHIWLTHSRPAGFLRWEGLLVLPSDPMIRVDLVGDSHSSAAQR